MVKRKYTDEQILEIRRLFEIGIKPAKIAKITGVPLVTVSNITRRHSHRKVGKVNPDKTNLDNSEQDSTYPDK